MSVLSPEQLEIRRAEHRVIEHGAAGARLRCDVVRVSGPDALTYLQGQCSQDLAALAPGTPTHSFVLEPGGKVDAWARVWSAPEGAFLFEVDAGGGPGLLARLERFKLRVAVDLELLDWELVAVRGPGAVRLDVDTADPTDAPFRHEFSLAGVPALDLVGPTVPMPDGVVEVGAEALDALRIEAGVPAAGSELGAGLDPSVIPAEAGEWVIEQSVSFTKGCYTGQELVARVDSRGSNTPRKLRGVVLDGHDVVPAGASVVVDGEDRGVVTSSGWSHALDAGVALAYVHRSVDPADASVPAELHWTDESSQPVRRAAQVRSLPLRQVG